MTRTIAGFVVLILSVALIAACGTDETETPGTLSAQITCTSQDSVLATAYLADGERAGASQWCSCGSEACSIEFDGLGYGRYVLGISVPDSLYKATEGAEGFARTLGYYGEGGLTETADTVTISAEQPTANLVIGLGDRPPTGAE